MTNASESSFHSAEAACRRLVAAVRGPEPLPAGGAAGVATIAMGIALAVKVVRLSPDAPCEVAEAGDRLDALLERLLPEFAADCAAFQRLLDAFGLPRDASRAAAIRVGWRDATAAPVRVAGVARQAVALLDRCVGRVNGNLAGDLAAARELIGAGLRIAIANARENAQRLAPEVAADLLSRLDGDR